MSSLDQALSKRILPAVVLDDAELAEPLAEALLAAGLDVIEITFRTAAAEEAIRRIAKRFPAMCLGAGTLLDPDQVRRAAAAGATFGVAPGLSERTAEAAGRCKLQLVPGVLTPSEVERALGLGFQVLKFFPAEISGGVKMLQALAGPFAHTGVKFVPTGGIDGANMRDYLALKVVAAVGGSWMVAPKLIAAQNRPEIQRLTREALAQAAN
jgi:2-dehydro-3-deoxyphosphogluconate aldolase/(4S)-4-hydroxy-2-oxoglutarate aldolase